MNGDLPYVQAEANAAPAPPAAIRPPLCEVTAKVLMRRAKWVDKLRPYLRERVNAEIDAQVEPASAIFARWNLLRFTGPRSFRQYTMLRRRRIQTYEAQRRRAAQATRSGPRVSED